MTQLLLPKLLTRESRSAVINISSRSAFSHSAFTPLYCATKAYNLALSKCMQDAYSSQSDKLDVMTVTPHAVKTALQPGHQVFTISAQRHGKAVVNQLGYQTQTRGSVWHAIQEYSAYVPPFVFACELYNIANVRSLLKEV